MKLTRRKTLSTAGKLAAAAALPLFTPLRGPLAQGQNTIRIGVLTDLSSLYTDLSGTGSVIAARMAAEDFNPGQHGFNVEFVSADHQNRADVGSNVARQWYDRDGVDMVVDLPNSAVALAVNTITREKNKVALVSTGASTALTGAQCSPNLVHWTYDTHSQPSATRWSPTPRSSSPAPAGAFWARCARPSPAPPTSPRSCCRRRPAAPR
jgi:branched-chain amino acid transport system substrate-binding protein